MATAVLLVCAGCGVADEGASAGSSATPARVVPSARDAIQAQGSDRGADMVRAVSAGGTAGGPVDLLFELKARPEVGEPVDIELALTPTIDLQRVIASFRAGEGLELRAGAEMPVLEKPETGVPVSHVLTIVPRRDGIFSVTAVVQADSSESSRTLTYTIPIIAGAGIAEPVAQNGGPGAGEHASASN